MVSKMLIAVNKCGNKSSVCLFRIKANWIMKPLLIILSVFARFTQVSWCVVLVDRTVIYQRSILLTIF